MSGTGTYFRILIFLTFAALVLVLMPTDARAHSSLDVDPVVELLSDDQDAEDHCHGAIECVVTLYLQETIDYSSSGNWAVKQLTLTGQNLAGVKLGRDPPVPI